MIEAVRAALRPLAPLVADDVTFALDAELGGALFATRRGEGIALPVARSPAEFVAAAAIVAREAEAELASLDEAEAEDLLFSGFLAERIDARLGGAAMRNALAASRPAGAAGAPDDLDPRASAAALTFGRTFGGPGERLFSPATPADVAAFARAAGVDLPPAFEALYRLVSDGTPPSARWFDPSETRLPAFGTWQLQSLRQVLEARHDFAALSAIHGAWRSTYLPFARDAFGNLLVADAVTPAGAVLIYAIRDRGARAVAPGFADFLAAAADALGALRGAGVDEGLLPGDPVLQLIEGRLRSMT